MAESTTAPIVVRGRSPRNFQARKEIPLLGSSAGSRGQALVESGLGVVAGTLSGKHQDAKARAVDMSMPRSAFTFSPPKPPPSQLSSMRSRSVLPCSKKVRKPSRRQRQLVVVTKSPLKKVLLTMSPAPIQRGAHRPIRQCPTSLPLKKRIRQRRWQLILTTKFPCLEVLASVLNRKSFL